MRAANLTEGKLPTPGEALRLAEQLLGDQGTRLAHVVTAGRIAHAVGSHLSSRGFLTPAEADLLEVAATVHDIGYSPAVAKTGFHPYDGGAHLRSLGWSARLARLVANHSCALVTAPGAMVDRLQAEFPAELGLLPDSLTYSDMHSSPAGQIIAAEVRLADIARRRPDPGEAARAIQLRLAMARVGDALLAVQEAAPPTARTAGHRGAARHVSRGLRAG